MVSDALSYLDNWLFTAPSELKSQTQLSLALETYQKLGLQINWKKSNLVPCQQASFIGACLVSTAA